MQVSVVMVMALSGLGCQNKGCDASLAPQTYYASRQCTTTAYPDPARSAYAAYAPGSYDSGIPTDYTVHGAVRSTLWSFILGRDPDVASTREIEATFYSGGYGVSYPGGYGH